MKQGLQFENFHNKLVATSNAAYDYVVRGDQLQLQDDGSTLHHPIAECPHTTLTDPAHDQIASLCGIPRAYYRKMREEQRPELLAANVNSWLKETGPRMIRTIRNDGSLPIEEGNFTRAILSDRYRRIDNYDVLNSLMPKVSETEFEVQSCDLTPYNMFLKVTFPFAKAEVAKGDVVEAGVVIRNSEIGWGSCSVSLFIHRLVCTNGMVLPESIYQARKYHVGKRLDFDHSNGQIISERTRMMEDAAFLSSLHDVIDAAKSEETLIQITDRFKAAAQDKMDGNIEEAVERLSKRLMITQDEQKDVMEHLVRDNDFSRWGFANAVTRTAQDRISYDRATELEKIGGQVIEMTSGQFEKLAA